MGLSFTRRKKPVSIIKDTSEHEMYSYQEEGSRHCSISIVCSISIAFQCPKIDLQVLVRKQKKT